LVVDDILGDQTSDVMMDVMFYGMPLQPSKGMADVGKPQSQRIGIGHGVLVLGNVLFIAESFYVSSYEAVYDASEVGYEASFHDDVLYFGVVESGVVADVCVGSYVGVGSDSAVGSDGGGSSDGGAVVDYGALKIG